MTKILAVGDLHGDWSSLNRLISKKNPDIILQCGDFGWWPQFEIKRPVLYGQHKKWLLRGIKPGNAKIYWCDGNHESYLHLQQYQNGKTHQMYKNVYYCSRGSVVNLPDDRRVLFMGGASSVDKNKRTPGLDWFPEENISQIDLDRALNIPRADIDIVVSHTCPDLFFTDQERVEKENDGNRKALNEILMKHRPNLWLFGHWHREISGMYEGPDFKTSFLGLDYPRHGGRWWVEI